MFMTTIVLEYWAWKIYFIEHDENENIEYLLFEKYNFYEWQINWMSVKDLDIQTIKKGEYFNSKE